MANLRGRPPKPGAATRERTTHKRVSARQETILTSLVERGRLDVQEARLMGFPRLRAEVDGARGTARRIGPKRP